MPVHGIDNGNNKHEVYTTEETLSILQQAIDSGTLQGIDPEETPIVAAVRESHNNSDVTFWSGTEAEFNELVGVTSELVGARIGSDGKLYILTGDTTLSDTVEAARQAALEATEGMKREVISVTLLANGWSNTAPYTQTVGVAGMTADKDFLAPYVVPTGNESDDLAAQVALSCISGGTTDTDSVTFYCYDEKPTTTITVFMVDKGTKIEPGGYPIASKTAPGIMKVGDGLNVDENGEVSVESYQIATYSFDNVAAMVAYNLAEGDTAITAGYYSVNDGGASTYKIVNSGATADGGSIIELANGLKAQLIVKNDTINVKQFGAKGDGTTDDTAAIAKALKFRGNDYLKVRFNKSETYIAQDTVYLYSNTEIDLDGATIKAPTELRMFTNEEAMTMTGYGVVKNISVRNGTFQGATGQVIFGLLHASNVKFEDIKFLDCGRSTHTIDMGGCDHVLVKNCQFIGSYIAAANKIREVIQTDYATRVGLPYWEDADAPAYDGLPTTDVEVTGCTFEIGDGTHYPNPLGTHSAGSLPIQRVRFTKNLVKNFAYSAVRFLSVDGLVIDDNVFVNEVDELLDQDVIAIRLANKTLSTETYPSVYLNNISIKNNRFCSTTSYINMTMMSLSARSDNYAKGIFVENNTYEGAWQTSADTHDFIQMSNVSDIAIRNNIVREPKIFVYAAGEGCYFGNIDVSGNKIYAPRDVYNQTAATLYPKNFTFDNNILVFESGTALNTSRFQESLSMSADFDATSTTNKVIPFDSYDANSPFSKNSSNKTLVPQALHQFKVGGAVTFSVATSRVVHCCIKYYKNTTGGGTKIKSDLEQYCVAGQQYVLTFPERNIEPVDFSKAEIQAWMEIGLQSGDKIIADGTVFNISGV